MHVDGCAACGWMCVDEYRVWMGWMWMDVDGCVWMCVDGCVWMDVCGWDVCGWMCVDGCDGCVWMDVDGWTHDVLLHVLIKFCSSFC